MSCQYFNKYLCFFTFLIYGTWKVRNSYWSETADPSENQNQLICRWSYSWGELVCLSKSGKIKVRQLNLNNELTCGSGGIWAHIPGETGALDHWATQPLVDSPQMWGNDVFLHWQGIWSTERSEKITDGRQTRRCSTFDWWITCQVWGPDCGCCTAWDKWPQVFSSQKTATAKSLDLEMDRLNYHHIHFTLLLL